jgi:hypothetical protein
MDAKYIAFDSGAVVFPPNWDHAQTAKKLGIARATISGAGFVSFNPDRLAFCHGESISLDIQSDSNTDTFMVRFLLGGPHNSPTI